MRNSFEYNLQLPPGIESFRGINLAWLRYATRSEESHDGYGTAFNDFYFNGTGANDSIKNQLQLLQENGYKTIRLWLNIYHYMNTDKETVGYTSFRPEFLKNLATYTDWCAAYGIKLLICLDDCWYTFPWTWVNDMSKKRSYIQACKDVVTALKDKPAVWGWDYCNEPYMGWSWSNPESTIHNHKGNPTNDIGYTRETLTNFFKELYIALKAIAPHHYFSVGSTEAPNNGAKELTRWDIKSAVDFYQIHTYGRKPEDFTVKASAFDKFVIIGEFGWNVSGKYMENIEYLESMYHRFFQLGFGLIMPWSITQSIQRKDDGKYLGLKSFTLTKLWQG